TPDGAGSRDGKITGTYLHGLFTNDSFRSAWLAQLGLGAGPTSYSQTVEDTLDALADHMETHLDVSALLARAAPVA
ncbi:MAG: cobyric acid synthase CobQ, partial [Sulfitobacter sp.]|nr:cobyric acid synthase CobQ [Sulfitobacter sp.]